MKKALIITYYWPPAGGPGVQRWLKFVKYLPKYNVEPIVYIPENPSYPITDERLVDDIPDHITILKQPIKEPYAKAGLLSKKNTKSISKGLITEPKKQGLIEKFMLYVRGNFFIPDARKSWIKPSVKFLSDYLNQNAIDTIITTGPPHSLHLIGLKLKEQLEINWLADFRDPWTSIGYHKKLRLSRASEKRHKQLEASVLNSADHIVVTSNITKAEFQSVTKRPITVITNGYDNELSETVQLDKKFTFAHIGSLLSDRNPEVLWKVLRELLTENKDFEDSFELNLIGINSEAVLQSIAQNNLKPFTNVIGYVSHDEAIKYQQRSQVLLLIEIDSEETRCIIPGKLFEYMNSKRPIIAIGPDGSDVKQIINDTQSGEYLKYDEHQKLKTIIINYFNLFRQKDLKSNPIGLEKYSRQVLTKSLAELI